MRPSEHINLVAILHVAWSVMLLIGACAVFVILGAGGLFAGAEGDDRAFIAIGVAMFATFMLAATGVVGMVGAWGLYRRRTWARFTIMVLSAIWLVKIPVGTALGAYSFYVLTRDEVLEMFTPTAPRAATA